MTRKEIQRFKQFRQEHGTKRLAYIRVRLNKYRHYRKGNLYLHTDFDRWGDIESWYTPRYKTLEEIISDIEKEMPINSYLRQCVAKMVLSVWDENYRREIQF